MLSSVLSCVQPVSWGASHCNGRLKISPSGGLLEAMYTSRPVFNWGGFESQKKGKKDDHFSVAKCGTENEEKGFSAASRRRAYKRVFDLAACNEGTFDLFITMTLDKTKVDRYDMDKIYPKLKKWLDNRVQRKGLKYIIVPEYHQDGAIHFHGLINSSAVKLKDSGKRVWQRDSLSYGKTIYNVADWSYGFTTACKLSGEYEHVCKYITKYVTKQTEGGMIGGRYYYHGGDLQEPHYEYINFIGEPEGKRYDLEDASLTVIYVTDLTKCKYEAASVRRSRVAQATAPAALALDSLVLLCPS